jgi:hypothetical protein
MKAYESGCIDPYFLDLGTSWRWVVSFLPRPLYPQGNIPGTNRIGGWVDHMVWTTWRRGNSWPYRDSNFDPSVVQPVASLYTDWAILNENKQRTPSFFQKRNATQEVRIPNKILALVFCWEIKFQSLESLLYRKISNTIYIYVCKQGFPRTFLQRFISCWTM